MALMPCTSQIARYSGDLATQEEGVGRMSSVRVGVLAYPGCLASEVFAIPDLLRIAMHIAGPDTGGYDVTVMSPRRRVTAAGGTALAVSAVREVDVLVVPGFELVPGLDLDTTLSSLALDIDVIRSHVATGNAVVSICVGAFLLAEAGALHGRRATTAWLFAGDLTQRCPETDVCPEQLVVTDAGVTTTAAFSAMYDVALDLIREHSGARVARTTARLTLLDDARSSQTPYVDADLLPRPGGGFAETIMRRLDQQLAHRYDLSTLADGAGVSTRTLLRRFAEETGQSPLQYLQLARVRRARHLLETTDHTVSSISVAVGYADAGTFAALFTRHTGQGPRGYRSAFRRRATSATTSRQGHFGAQVPMRPGVPTPRVVGHAD
jgi:transcriptional regulator GlxA family with amidase domain